MGIDSFSAPVLIHLVLFSPWCNVRDHYQWILTPFLLLIEDSFLCIYLVLMAGIIISGY